MVTKKAPSRKRTKKPAKSTRNLYKTGETNRKKLVKAGVINADYDFNPEDAAAIETLSNQEVNVLIEVFNDLGEEFFENNSPNGFVF